MKRYNPGHTTLFTPDKSVYIKANLIRISFTVSFYIFIYLAGGINFIFLCPVWMSTIFICALIALGLVILAGIRDIINLLSYPSDIDLRTHLIAHKLSFERIVVAKTISVTRGRGGFVKTVSLVILYTEKIRDVNYKIYALVSSSNEYFDLLRNFAIQNNIYTDNLDVERHYGNDLKKFPDVLNYNGISVPVALIKKQSEKQRIYLSFLFILLYTLLYYLFIGNYTPMASTYHFVWKDFLQFVPFSI